MEKRQPYGSLDYLGADTYGWPLPARQIAPAPTLRKAESATVKAPVATDGAATWEQTAAPRPAPAIPLAPAEPIMPITAEVVPTPIEAVLVPSVDEVCPVAIEAAPVVEEMHPITVEVIPVVEEVRPIAIEVIPMAVEAAPIPAAEEICPITVEVIPVMEEVHPIVADVIPDSVAEETCPDVVAPPPVTTIDTPMAPPRLRPPSIFADPEKSAPIRPTDFWSKPSKSAAFSDWRQVIEASTPAEEPQPTVITDPTVDYPPVVVSHPNDMAARQVLRLYVGEKSAMTLFQCYLYNSICFEEDCPQLAPLMNRLATETLFFAQMLGKLSLAFGADPRPRAMQSQRGQYWSGSFVPCARVPRKAILNLTELERHLCAELSRFMNATRDTGARALIARMLADSEQRTGTLTHTLTLGCV